MKRIIPWIGRGAVLLGFAAGVVVLMLWLAGKFSPKVPATADAGQAQASSLDGHIVRVQLIQLPLTESAIGTIRAVHETTIGSKLLARVVEVNLKAGQKVKAGEVLLRLDDTDLRAKLQQAKAAVASIEAVRAQAAADEKRYAALIESKAISRQDYEKAVTTLRSAEADLLRAQETVNEVQTNLDSATVRSPFDGTVIDKKVDVGDMITPGQMLVTLFDPKRMQLVASVRESLTRQLKIGQSIGVRIDGLNKQCSGTVSEIVPEAQSASRAFQVKVTGPCPTGIYSGMFGRILIPLEKEEVLVIPRQAVRKVGQLELVQAIEKGRTIQRAIRTGRILGDIQDEGGQVLRDQVEVLSGLRQGEQVVLPAGSKPEQAAPSCPVEPLPSISSQGNHSRTLDIVAGTVPVPSAPQPPVAGYLCGSRERPANGRRSLPATISQETSRD
ncbi:MAG: efflux RND transporter periplasmic adaptor subunit [Planctomycetota bacterium]